MRAAVSLTLLALTPAVLRADVDYAALARHQGRAVTGIELTGQRVTDTDVITREIETPLDEPFRLESLREDVQRLENLQVFSSIDVEAQPDGDEGVRLRFVFKEMPSWVPLPAFTYTEENGFSIGPAVSALNLAGRDITVGVRAYFGGTTQYRLSLSWPWIAGDDHLGLDFYAAHREREDVFHGFMEKSDELTPRVGRYLGERGRLAGLFSFFRMRSDVDGKTLSPDNVDDLIRLGVSLGWDSRDSWTRPRLGWWSELEVWRTGGWLGGDGSFWTMNLDLRRWQEVRAADRLLLSGLLTLQSGTSGVDFPEYMDFHLGGANTIRGYDVEDLGRRLFGKNQLLGTAEYSITAVRLRRVDIWKLSLRLGLELAFFADAGIAWDEASDFAMRRARGGIGTGLRLLVPNTEMVRLDLGWSPEGGFQIHFAGGSKPNQQRNRLR